MSRLQSGALQLLMRDVGLKAAIGSRVDLRIVDRGPGVPVDQRERIFEPFQRLGDRSNGSGVGLGLAVAKGFMEATGGSITIDDTPAGSR